MEHLFTEKIKTIVEAHFGTAVTDIYDKSLLLQYLNIKTRSATSGSKARSSFGNIYAIYVLVEDYLTHHFDKTEQYFAYEGARFTDLFRRQRELPFGGKLQNHALNHRMNEEFKKYFPQSEYVPVLRDVTNNRYWFNENLLKIRVADHVYNIAGLIIEIIDAYINVKQSAFQAFIDTCEQLKVINQENEPLAEAFVLGLLAPQVDARVFEIVSYAILKYYYNNQVVYFGFDITQIQEENLKLYKTGRTNANDGGIDFVMKPIGRFFQVTETLDVRKYFLDIDKVERYPISFVIKSEEPIETLHQNLRAGAKKQYGIQTIVERYMSCIEEIINIPELKIRFRDVITKGCLFNVLDEIIKQSKVEFNDEWLIDLPNLEENI